MSASLPPVLNEPAPFPRDADGRHVNVDKRYPRTELVEYTYTRCGHGDRIFVYEHADGTQSRYVVAGECPRLCARTNKESHGGTP